MSKAASEFTMRCDMHNRLDDPGYRHDDRVYSEAEQVAYLEWFGHGRCERCNNAVIVALNPRRTDEQDATMRETIAWIESLGIEWSFPPVEPRGIICDQRDLPFDSRYHAEIMLDCVAMERHEEESLLAYVAEYDPERTKRGKTAALELARREALSC